MRQKNTVSSLPGFMLLIILFSGLGAVLWRSGGLAFSPGALSAKSLDGITKLGYASHAEFERECRLCHQSLKGQQADLCLACHTRVAAQVATAGGLHGKFPQVRRCFECHSDHRGRDFDPVAGALEGFNHTITAFTLDWHQVNYDATPIECSACHKITPDFTIEIFACRDCHASRNAEFMRQHEQDFGLDCVDCHDGKDRLARFDHRTTAFPLDGGHAEVRCASCHDSGNFDDLPLECAACHTEPEVHQGSFELECGSCHDIQGWKPALMDGAPFDHTIQSGFSLDRHKLDYDGETLACQGCHTVDTASSEVQTCAGCHAAENQAFIDQHISQFNQNCLECHDGADRMSGFNHASFFPLEGRHAEIECEACHVGNSFRGTPGECARCHDEPQIHAGFFGLKCEYCHTSSAWAPAQIQIHPFPLDHGGGQEIACQTCHTTGYPDYGCYGCHDHQPQPVEASHAQAGIGVEELPDCAGCHPTGMIEETGG